MTERRRLYNRSRAFGLLWLVTAIFAVLVAGSPFLSSGAAAQTDSRCNISGQKVVKRCKLGLNKALVIDLPRDARDVLVSNPVIAEAVMRTSRRIYLTGVRVGQADIFVFDRAGNEFVHLELEVERDNTQLESIIARLVPEARVDVEVINDNVVLKGTVPNAGAMNRVVQIAKAFANGGANAQTMHDLDSGASAAASAGNGTAVSISGFDDDDNPTSTVVNLLTIEGDDQVQIKVTVAEVKRDVIKQLGLNLSDISAGDLTAGVITSYPTPVAGRALGLISGEFTGSDVGLTATLTAMEQEGLVRTLAEPTLTAISGESASFLAGGEFPVPVGSDEGNVRIEYKPYGVGLAFTPVVLSEGRISLRVKTEVSEMSNDGNYTVFGDSTTPSLNLASIRVRRAETVLELPSGGAMVLGGLLQDDVRQAISGVPGLKNLPVLGALFKSRDFIREQTELLIIVTPYLVKPVARAALARPDDGLEPSDDAAAMLMGRLHRIYGSANASPPAGTYHGRYGYIFE